MKIGFISTRFAGLDGVSLESQKWAEVLSLSGHEIFWFAGELDMDPSHSFTEPLAHFDHPEIKHLSEKSFGHKTRSRALSNEIHRIRNELKNKIYEFVTQYKLDILILQNAVTIPMNLALGYALTEFVAETNFPVIAHHHDFYWERKRFDTNCVEDILDLAFPCALQSMVHVTINTSARRELSFRKGVSSYLVANVMDFDRPVDPPDMFAKTFRERLQIREDQVIILQPTRVIPRKGIGYTIDLASQIKDLNPVILVTHQAGDEGFEYKNSLKMKAEDLQVDLRFIDDFIAPKRAIRPFPRFSLEDAYSQADIVAFPSTYEGFGNALLEAVLYKKPVFVNRYKVFKEDIEPMGGNFIMIDQYVSERTIEHIRKVLTDKEYQKEMCELNFEIFKRYFSYPVLRDELNRLLQLLSTDKTHIHPPR